MSSLIAYLRTSEGTLKTLKSELNLNPKEAIEKVSEDKGGEMFAKRKLVAKSARLLTILATCFRHQFVYIPPEVEIPQKLTFLVDSGGPTYVEELVDASLDKIF